jgi:hypothetical protein
MKTLKLSVLILLLSASVYAQSESKARLPLRTILSATQIRFTGTAANINCNKSTGLTFVVYEKFGRLHADGRYDSVNLFGRFKSVEFFATRIEDDFVCIQFKGVFRLGDDGSGFPSGTQTHYTMNILMTRDGAKGIYRIGKPDEGVDWEQYGDLDLTWEIVSD